MIPSETPPVRHNLLQMKYVVAPVVAGLALAACTTTPGRNSPAESPSVAETSVAAEGTSTPRPSKSEEALPETSATTEAAEPGLAGCKPYFDTAIYTNHEYEVCTAYVYNAGQVALQGFYKYGNNEVLYVADAARHHFENRYWEQPRETIEAAVDTWPKTSSVRGNTVAQTVTVQSLSANLEADRAVLQTRESWRVIQPDGTLLYNEPVHDKDVTMCRGRQPGHPLHEWVVVADSRISDYDCIGFNKTHGINRSNLRRRQYHECNLK